MKTRTLALLCCAVWGVITLGGCTSPEQHAAARRERLLTVYPLSTTTHADVQKRWSPVEADLSETRPASGWGACTQRLVREHVTTSEQRTGQTVYRCERYLGADGLSGGLCYSWFYYDNKDHLVDAEWQWHTD
jgi:ABC-type phosphate/phosphonate transport system substrate-binding protein